MIYGTDWGAYLSATKGPALPFKDLYNAGLLDFFVTKGNQEADYYSSIKNIQWAREAGCQCVGSYYWHFPTWGADYQIEVYSQSILAEKPDFIALDMEDSMGCSDWQITTNAEAVLAGLAANFPDLKLYVYTSADYINGFCPTFNRSIGKYGRWIACWPGTIPPIQERYLSFEEIKQYPLPDWEVALPYGWTGWDLWQDNNWARPEGYGWPFDHQYDWNVSNLTIEQIKGKEPVPTMTTLYKQTTPQTGRAKVLTYNTTQKMTVTPDQLGNELAILPMGGMDFWDGSHMRLYSVPSFKGRRAEFAGANIPVGGRFMIDAGYWLKEQHTAPEVISQSCGGNMDEIQKQASARANLCLPHLFDAWCDGAWTWDSIFNKTAKFADIKFLELGMIATEGFAGAGIGDYWQTISFQHLSQPLNWLKLRGYIPNIPLVMYTGPWWLSLYQGGEFAIMLANAKTWLYLHLGQWVLTSTATFPTLDDIFKFRPEETFAFSNYPDGYFERIWMHEYTGEAQKCAQLVDAAGQPTTVNLSLWNDRADEMKKALGISITPPPSDLEARVTALEERVTILERDVATLAAIIRGEISMPFGKPFNATITLNGPEGG